MKRLLLIALIASPLAAVAVSQAGCTSENRGGSASGYDTGHAAYGNVTIDAYQYGNFAGGPAFLCSDGTAGVDAAARGGLVIKVDGDVVCSSSQRLSTDPFGFGAGVHSPTSDPCGAEISWSGITAVFLPDPADVAADADGASAGLRKTTTVAGTIWYDGNTYTLPAEAAGYYTRGVRAASEH